MPDEQAVLDQVWAALPVAPQQRDVAHVLAFLEREGLLVSRADDASIVYTYADGPREPGSPVECEWYLEFRFDHDDRMLGELAVEKRLVGP